MKRDFVKYGELVNEDIQKYLDKKTGLISEKYTTKRACPVCNYPKKKFLFNKQGFTHVKCPKCSLVYVDPTISESYLKKFYKAKSYVYYASLMTKEAIQRRDKRSEKIFKKINKQFKFKKGRLLDIGCGYGAILKVAKLSGWDVYGTDYSEDCKSYIKKELGIDIKQQDLLDLDFKENFFDIIVLKQVIEHLNEPKKTLIKINQLLRPGGMLWLATPNSKGLCALLMGKYNPSYQRGHINIFNRLTMIKILKESGFRKAKISTYYLKALSLFYYLKGKKDIRMSVYKKLNRLPTQGGMERKIFYKLIQPLLSKIAGLFGVGDYLEVIAYK